MGTTIAQLLPLALGIALNPIPVIAVILILLTPRARTNGFSFLAGWLGGLLAVGAVGLTVANRSPLYGIGTSSSLASWLKVGLGILVLGLAAKKWLSRPRSAADAVTPRWMDSLAAATPLRSLGLGAGLGGVWPKNLVFTVAAAAGIAEADLPIAQEAVAFLAFTLVATAGVATPVVVLVVLGDRSAAVLERWGAWLTRNNATLMVGVLVVIGLLALVSGASALL